MKPVDPARCRAIDKAIDAALDRLRTAAPVAASSADALEKLIAIMDAAK